jgi:hypothetical protein
MAARFLNGDQKTTDHGSMVACRDRTGRRCACGGARRQADAAMTPVADPEQVSIGLSLTQTTALVVGSVRYADPWR